MISHSNLMIDTCIIQEASGGKAQKHIQTEERDHTIGLMALSIPRTRRVLSS